MAIFTGAGGGLGREHALVLVRRGAKVVVNDLGGSVTGEGASRVMRVLAIAISTLDSAEASLAGSCKITRR